MNLISIGETLYILFCFIPEREVCDMTVAVLQCTDLLLNLNWFQRYQMILKMLVMEARMAKLHRGDQPMAEIKNFRK